MIKKSIEYKVVFVSLLPSIENQVRRAAAELNVCIIASLISRRMEKCKSVSHLFIIFPSISGEVPIAISSKLIPWHETTRALSRSRV